MGNPRRHGWLALGGSAALCVGALAAAAQGCTILSNDAPLDDAGNEAGNDAGSCTTCVAVECAGPWAVCLLDGTCRGIHACATSASSAAAKLACACGTEGDAGDDDAAMADAAVDASLEAGSPLDSLAAYRMFASCNDVRTCSTCAAQCASTCSSGGSNTRPGSCDAPVDAGADVTDAAKTDASDAGDAGDAASDAAAADGGDAGGEVVPDAGTPFTAEVERCSACVTTSCADPKKACAAGTECASFLACMFACGAEGGAREEACAAGCATTYPAGKTAATSLSSCTISSCSGACGL
ncbi:MAG: hypothetical protein JST00_28895 [Deltaproteobacteria bacterium]|nr:hypothetical protein [Deltaproteobacteria bacterium]